MATSPAEIERANVLIKLNDEAKKGAVVQVTMPPHVKHATDIIVTFGEVKATTNEAINIVRPEKGAPQIPSRTSPSTLNTPPNISRRSSSGDPGGPTCLKEKEPSASQMSSAGAPQAMQAAPPQYLAPRNAPPHTGPSPDILRSSSTVYNFIIHFKQLLGSY
ncbi:hypothetical protein M422DRAFT_245833 [Sphaerobolus stellatus SS14]|nr:hypothetical protein M422DRAFT_245833 [Sphaerobolus stellatus SS14]